MVVRRRSRDGRRRLKLSGVELRHDLADAWRVPVCEDSIFGVARSGGAPGEADIGGGYGLVMELDGGDLR